MKYLKYCLVCLFFMLIINLNLLLGKEKINLVKLEQKRYIPSYYLNNILKRYKHKSYSSKQYRYSNKFIIPVKGKIYQDTLRKGIYIKPYSRYKTVRAAKEGVVVFAGFLKYYGNVVIIKHKNGYKTIYTYLKKLYVKKGTKVKKGESIATFYKKQPIYFEVRKNYKCLNVVRNYKRIFENG